MGKVGEGGGAAREAVIKGASLHLGKGVISLCGLHVSDDVIFNVLHVLK